MNLLHEFTIYLIASSKDISRATVRNYTADVSKFINWIEQKTGQVFTPSELSYKFIEEYKDYQTIPNSSNDSSSLSARSFKRHISSMKKFMQFLVDSGYLKTNPLSVSQIQKTSSGQDDLPLKQYKDFLFLEKLSTQTIRNYIIDIQQFLDWVKEVSPAAYEWDIRKQNIHNFITITLIEEYKSRLLNHTDFSPASINRKLSSIRKYIVWAQNKGLIEGIVKNEANIEDIVNISNKKFRLLQPNDSLIISSDQHIRYSSVPPVRMAQKIYRMYDSLVDSFVILPLANGINNVSQKFNKPPVFTPSIENNSENTIVTNIEKKFYAPITGHPANSLHYASKWINQDKRTLKMYNKHQRSQQANIFRVWVICIVLLGVGYVGYNKYNDTHTQTLGTSTSSKGKTIFFHGRLADRTNNPLTGVKDIRFSLYSSSTATGSALLWEEARPVTFDENGKFSVLLGNNRSAAPLTQDLFSTNDSLYLGIAVGNNQELLPRQQLTNVSYARNADTVAGLTPSTQVGSQTRNVLLAVDSGGDITLAGEDSHTLQTPDGQLKLLAKQLVLTTSPGTSGDIQLSPDDMGQIDIQKPIHNSSNNNNIGSAVGAVEVDDLFAILATSSAQSAFTVNQNGAGNIISASSSGIARFTLGSDGTTYFGGNVGVGTITPAALLSVEGTNPGKSLSIFNATGTEQAIITASSSGKVKFSVDTNGHILSASGAKWYPLTDSQTALSIANANKDSFITFDTSNSRLGIGTTSPFFKADIVDNQAATVAAMITNSSTSNEAGVLALKLGNTNSLTGSNRFVTFLNGNGKAVGTIEGNTSGGVTYTTAGSDFAEYYRKEDPGETLLSGTLLCLGRSGGATKCSSLISFDIVGVVSNNAGFAGGSNHKNDPGYVLVGLSGQLPVAIDDTVGINDSLTVSSYSNVATKATKKSYVVGRVIAPPYIDSSTHQKMAMTSLRMMFFDPEVSISLNGDLSNVASLTQSDKTRQENPSFTTVLAQTIKTASIQTKALIVDETAKFKQVTLDSLIVQTSNVLIAGVSLQSYIQQVVRDTLSQQDKITSPLAEVSSIHTNVISPLTDKNLVIKFTQENSTSSSALEIQNSSGSVVASLTSSGDAEFTGTVSAKNASISGSLSSNNLIAQQTTTDQLSAISATVSGILHVKKLIADEIENNSSSPLVSPTPSPTPTPSSAPQAIDIASYSGQLKNIKDLYAETGTFTQGLMAFGPASFSQVAISSQLSVGASLSLSNNSINALGTDLELQPLKQGGVSFLSGAVRIDMNGNLVVNGNASFASNVDINGTLSANVISPLPGKNLTMVLANSTDSASSSALVIQNASGSGVLQVDNSGNITASGSATVNDIITKGLGIIRSVQADTSLTETLASASAGTATIINGETQRTIITPYVKENSLIYVSPTSDTYGVTPYVARQTVESGEKETKGSFTIQIPQRIYQDLRINWWIVN